MEHATYRKLVAKDTHEDREAKLSLLAKVAFLENVSYDNREKLLGIMTARKFTAGEVVVTKEKSEETFFIVSQGQVEVKTKSKEATMGAGKHVGDHVLSNSAKKIKAEITAKSTGLGFTVSSEDMRSVIGTPWDLIPVEVDTLGAVVGLRQDPYASFPHLPREQTVRLSHRIQNTSFMPCDVIAKAGEEIDACLYLVREGKAFSRKGRIKSQVPAGAIYGEAMFIECREKKTLTCTFKAEFVADTECVEGMLTLEDY